MRVLLSAFACQPDKGSEPEVGFQTMLRAARRHEVWVLTHDGAIPALRRFLDLHPLAPRIHLEAVPLGIDESRLGLFSFHWYYDRWQRRAGELARELDRRLNFDVVHHVTLASIWTRVGVAAVPKPLVWGPAGGGVEPPLPLLAELGLRGGAEAAARLLGRRLLTRLPHAQGSWRTAAVALAQNQETAHRIRRRLEASILSNATSIDLTGIEVGGARTTDIVFAGRLVAWKGARLIVRALRYLQHPQAVLRLYGEGSDRRRIERAARRWDVSHRVVFEGRIRRDALLPRLSTAGVLVHPSLHDDAALSVAEALSLGTPVVCLDHGGPAEITPQWPTSPSHRVPVGDPETTARRLADAIDHYLVEPPPVRTLPVASEMAFGHRLLSAYEQAALIGKNGAHPRISSAMPNGRGRDHRIGLARRVVVTRRARELDG